MASIIRTKYDFQDKSPVLKAVDFVLDKSFVNTREYQVVGDKTSASSFQRTEGDKSPWWKSVLKVGAAGALIYASPALATICAVPVLIASGVKYCSAQQTQQHAKLLESEEALSPKKLNERYPSKQLQGKKNVDPAGSKPLYVSVLRNDPAEIAKVRDVLWRWRLQVDPKQSMDRRYGCGGDQQVYNDSVELIDCFNDYLKGSLCSPQGLAKAVSSDQIFVAKDADGVIQGLEVVRSRFWKKSEEILYLITAPKNLPSEHDPERISGVGQALFETAVHAARRADADKIELLSAHSACGFYSTMNCKGFGARHFEMDRERMKAFLHDRGGRAVQPEGI